jgi:hypothetical protein
VNQSSRERCSKLADDSRLQLAFGFRGEAFSVDLFAASQVAPATEGGRLFQPAFVEFDEIKIGPNILSSIAAGFF